MKVWAASLWGQYFQVAAMEPTHARFTFDYMFFGFMLHQVTVWAPNIPYERKFVVTVAVSTFKVFELILALDNHRGDGHYRFCAVVSVDAFRTRLRNMGQLHQDRT